MCGEEVKSLEKGLFPPTRLVCILWPVEPSEFRENVLLSELSSSSIKCGVTVLTSLNNDYLLEFSDVSGLVFRQLFVWKEEGQLWKRFIHFHSFLLHLPAAAVCN